ISFLAGQKGQAKLHTSLRTLSAVNDSLREVFPSQVKMWQTSAEDLERRYREAQQPLEVLEQTRRAMVASVESSIKDIGRGSRALADRHVQSLPDKVRQWAADYEPENGVGLPPRKATLEPLVKEIVDHLKQKITEDTAQWNQSTLAPMIDSEVSRMQQGL